MLRKIFNNNHFQSGLTQLITAVVSFCSFIILVRGMSENNFGIWVIYLSLLTFTDMLKAGVVQTALIKYGSGSEPSDKKVIIGSSWLINIIITSCLTLLFLTLYFILNLEANSIGYFLFYYPIYSFASMPFRYILWNAQLNFNFKKISIYTVINAIVFLLLVSLFVGQTGSVELLVIYHIIGFVCSGILGLFQKETGVKYLNNFTLPVLLKIWNFGKFHSLAFIGSNLLRSSDVFIIGLLGNPFMVAIYGVPLRLVEIIEMPIKSVVKVAFPTFSKLHNNNKTSELKALVESYLGVMSMVYVPFMLLLFFFSSTLIEIIGGEAYLLSVPIFQVFVAFGFFLPFDRLTGITLDALDMPKYNLYKVILMASVNIVGDFIAMYFYNSLELVAFITILNVITGIVVGFLLLKKYLKISLKGIFTKGTTVLSLFIINSISLLFNQKKNNYENS